ncbi:DUF4192 domain-containing protein [Saccharopolyspora thermophila]|nr:DUF4192 domain-containing protein [Saccharopolyspora subtropica]
MTTRLNTTISLTDPAELLAAVPHLLGFHPTDSLVVVTLRGLQAVSRLGATLRIDLPCPQHIRGFGERLLTGPLRRTRLEAALLVVVGHRPHVETCGDVCAGTCSPAPEPSAVEPLSGGGPPYAGLVEEIRETFRRDGIGLAHALWTPEIRAGAEWCCYHDPECTGAIPDPRSSALAAAMAAAGAVTFDSRDELRALVAPESPEAVARVSAKLDALTEDLIEGSDQQRVAESLRTVLGAIERTASGAALTEDDHVRVLLAVSDTRVRDLVLGSTLGGAARAAEELWLTLVRKAPEPELAEVAALLAFSAYLRGDGALAGVALERIERTSPDHRLGTLLRRALDVGIPPAELAVIARDAAEDAQLMIEEDGAW